jgi:hypothetical protein
MARAGGQDGDVAGLQREYSTFLAAEADPTLAARDAEDIMDPGVIVHVVVDAVAPCVAPSVRLEQILDHRRRVVALIEIDGASIVNSGTGADIGPLLAQMRSAERIKQCPASGAKRKTSPRNEYFAF